jgi:phytoene dehydrogenase-like protein
MSDDWDAVVVGAGPNGLVAAATLGRAGWKVLVLEAAPTVGGGTRSAELTRPGFIHDRCSSVHPLGVASPALRDLGLADSVDWCYPEVQLAHPLDGGRAALLTRSVDETADGLGADAIAYRRLMEPLVASADRLTEAVLSPLTIPPARALPALARFGWDAAPPAAWMARHRFDQDEARGLMAGLAAHSMLSLRSPGTAGFGLYLGVLGHAVGWPVARGGSQAIADQLADLVTGAGGQIEVDRRVSRWEDLPPARATLLDLSPRQLVDLAGPRLPARYRRRLERYRSGSGVWKVDWALDGPIPWTNPGARRAATVHVGGTLAQVVSAEADVARGRLPARPFVLVVQPTVADPGRAPAGGHIGWAYCHVPNGSTFDMTERIEAQIERFAPGFGDRIVARAVAGPADLERHDANYLGGDIAIGRTDLTQLVTRPVASAHPWRTPVPGLYLCSSATPPGPGVHGMCGWHAARTALADLDPHPG